MRPRSLLLLGLLGLLLIPAIRPVWSLDPDAAAYLTLARSVASGEGYVLDGVPHAKYPPGLPLLLAGLARIWGPDAYGAFHGALVGALILATALAYGLARQLGYRRSVALAVAACTGLSQTLFDLSVRYLRTEVLFLCLTLAALVLTLRALSSRGGLLDAVLAALVTVAAMSVRLAGVSLLVVPAWRLMVGGAPSTRPRAALILVAGLAGLALWTGRAAEIRSDFPEAPDYGSEFFAAEPRDLTKVVRDDMPTLDASGFVRRVAGNLEVLARATAVLLTNVDKAGARLPVGALLLAVTAVGLVALARTRRTIADTEPAAAALSSARTDVALYVGATVGLYLVWPFNQQERFYAPLLPLLLLAAGEGIAVVHRLVRSASGRRGLRLALLAAGALVVVVLAMQKSDDPTVLGRWSRSYAALIGAATIGWIVVAVILARGALGPLPQAAGLALPILFAVTFAQHRFVEWPSVAQDFVQRREKERRDGPLTRIDVHPLLEQVADFLRMNTPRDAVVMTDVPKMMAILSERRCVPFVYRLDPPAILHGDADYLFYTHEIREVSEVLDARSADYQQVVRFPATFDGVDMVQPTIYSPRR